MEKHFFYFSGHIIDAEKVSYISPLIEEKIWSTFPEKHDYQIGVIVDGLYISITLGKSLTEQEGEDILNQFKLLCNALCVPSRTKI